MKNKVSNKIMNPTTEPTVDIKDSVVTPLLSTQRKSKNI